MEDKVSNWQMAGFIFTAILGTLLHFLYDWTGQSPAAGLISAVNESIWEHMKLIFVPMVVFALIQRRFGPQKKAGFWWVKLLGILLALVLIPGLYYTYTGAFGVEVDWLNIAIFFLAAGISFRLEAWLLQREKTCPLPDGLAVGILVLMAGAFGIFTFAPPRIPLFRDPRNGSFGFPRAG